MTRLLILLAIFGVATLTVVLLVRFAPDFVTKADSELNGDHQQSSFSLELPTAFENFTKIAEKFRAYKADHSIYITALFICVYLYKQTFAIPGSFLLNILAGILYGLWPGFVLCCTLTTCGSSLCYLFSELFSREYVLYYFGERISYLQQKVDDNSHRLLAFLLFARMFPISPSWLLNIVAPFLNIPLPIFAFSAFVGLAPYNFICVQAGFILRDLKSWDDVFSTTNMLKLCSLALVPLAYAIFKRPPHQKLFMDRIKHSLKSMQICFGGEFRRPVDAIQELETDEKSHNFSKLLIQTV